MLSGTLRITFGSVAIARLLPRSHFGTLDLEIEATCIRDSISYQITQKVLEWFETDIGYLNPLTLDVKIENDTKMLFELDLEQKVSDNKTLYQQMHSICQEVVSGFGHNEEIDVRVNLPV